MNYDGQTIIVGVLIAAALCYIARRLWLRVRGTEAAGCASGCGKCGDNTTAKPAVKRVVMVELQGRKK